MKRLRTITPSALAISAAILLLITGAYQASVKVVDPDGHLLSVEIVYDSVDPSIQGLALVDEGPTVTTTDPVSSTMDEIIDKDPTIALDPVDGQPVLVWSRQAGGDYELAMLRHMPGGWGPIDILTSNTTQDISPRALVDAVGRAHVLWYPSGIGGPVYLQGFYTNNGHAAGPPQKPLEPTAPRPLKSGTTGGSDVGGGDDPGLIGGLTSKASENPCLANPAAAPDHGVVMACGRPAAYQISSCQLVVGVYDTLHWTWAQTVSDLSGRNLSGTSVRDIAQGMANTRCN